MKSKIALVGILFSLFISNVFAKSPPLGTGALVPTNIMLMLDNSGSMAWDLSGNQLTSGSFLNNPDDINVDSKGNIYVWSSSNTVIEGKNYKMLVFNPDGTFKKAMIEYNGSGQAYFNQTCGKSYGSNPKFDIHNDQIYYLDSGFRTSIHVVDLNGNCIRTKQLDHQYYGGYWSPYMTIDVTDSHIYLGTGRCSFYCYNNAANKRDGQRAAGSITILTRSNLNKITSFGGQGSYYQHNLWGDQSDIAVSPDGTKIAVASKGASSVCLHDISNGGTYISSSCTKVGGRPNGRPNQNYDRTWWKAWAVSYTHLTLPTKA